MASPELPLWLDVTLPPPEELWRRLQLLIPHQVDPHGWVRREMAAKTLFVMLYGYAIEGLDRWIRPTAVGDMTDAQAGKYDPTARREWLDLVQSPSRPHVEGWYSENTREPIRDETIKRLIELGIVRERPGLATTSPKPRYAIARHVLPVLAPDLSEAELETRIESWQKEHLSREAQTRLALVRSRAVADDEAVLVKLPNGEVRALAPGPSSGLTKAVVETFAPRFLKRPALVLMSESAHKVSFRDEGVLRQINLDIHPSGPLPDVLLVDLDADPLLLVFVECVVTGGAIAEPRREQLEQIATTGGYERSDCAFVSAFFERADSPYRSLAPALSWGSFVWFETEPAKLIYLCDAGERPTLSLASLLRSD